MAPKKLTCANADACLLRDRLLNCLQPTSVPALAAALAGCQQLKELDVSYISLGCVQACSSSAIAGGSSSQAEATADTAWSGLIEVRRSRPAAYRLRCLTVVQVHLSLQQLCFTS